MAMYRVYGNYVYTKHLGDYEAESKQEAIQKALDEADGDISLCYDCGHKFVDYCGALDEEGINVEILEGD